MKKILTTILSLALCFTAVSVFAQAPANDDCANAVALTIYPDEASCVQTTGTTVNGTASASPTSVCSGSWFSDDVWFSFTTGATVPSTGVAVKVTYGTATSVGMALYASCGANETPLGCFSDCNGGLNQLVLFNGSMMPNSTYYARVWSGCSPTANSGTFDICVFELEADTDPTVWGPEDFANGLAGNTASGPWTTVGVLDSVLDQWVFEADATANGAFRTNTITSPTSFNGCMLYDADDKTTSIDPSPAGPPYPQHTGTLESPIIDATNFPPVSVKFYQAYEALNGDTYFDYSLDGGTTWELAGGANSANGLNVNEDIAANDGTPSPDFKKIFLPGASGSSQLVLKFTADMDFYNWMIDDVELVETERHNLRITDFVALPPSINFPVDQGDDVYFLADIENIGADAQTNVNLNVTVTDAGGAVVYNQDLAYGTITSDSLAENQLFPMAWTPDASTPTTYTATYTLTADSTDFDAADNTFSYTLNIVDSVFSKNTGITGGVSPADDDSYTYGTVFYANNAADNGMDPAPNPYYVPSMQFGCSNVSDMIGRSVDIYLYEWDDIDGDLQIGALGTELFIRTLQTYTFTGGETDDTYITVPMEDFNNPGDPYYLQANTNYVLAVQYAAAAPGETFFISVSRDYDYRAADLAFETANVTPRYRQALDVGNTGDLNGQFGGAVVPALQMTVLKDVTSTEEVSILPSNALKVFPSPATDFINVDLDFEEMAEDVTISVYDIKGQLLQTKQMSNVIQDRVNFDVSNYAAGKYLVSIVADNGISSKFFTVVR